MSCEYAADVGWTAGVEWPGWEWTVADGGDTDCGGTIAGLMWCGAGTVTVGPAE